MTKASISFGGEPSRRISRVLTSEEQAQYEKRRKEIGIALKSRKEAAKNAEHLTAADYAVTINCKG
jgi:hypothetical protein